MSDCRCFLQLTHLHANSAASFRMKVFGARTPTWRMSSATPSALSTLPMAASETQWPVEQVGRWRRSGVLFNHEMVERSSWLAGWLDLIGFCVCISGLGWVGVDINYSCMQDI